MHLSLGVTTSMPVGLSVRYAHLAEEEGYHRIWVGEDLPSREIFAYLSVLALRTSGIGLASGIVSLYARNLAVIATSASGLQALSGGRFSLGLGVGGIPEVEALTGERPRDVVRVMEEGMGLLRRLWAGETVTYEGVRAKFDGYGLASPPETPPRIYVGARGPRLLSLAGATAEGCLMSGPEAYLMEGLRALERGAGHAGRDPRALERIVWNGLVVGEEEKDLRLAGVVAATMAASLPDRVLRAMGGVEGELKARIKAGDYRRAGEMLKRETIAQLCTFGSLEEISDRIGELEAMGFTEFVVGPPFGRDPEVAIRGLAEMI